MAGPVSLLTAILAVRVAAAATPGRCGNSTSFCPSAEDCCSVYSPSLYGCSVDVGALTKVSTGCGDGLPASPICCKMGPANPPSTMLPNVLIIGDSVSIGYTTLASKSVIKLLEGKAQVQHGPYDTADGGAGDTAYGLACLDRWLVTQTQQEVAWDLITFNFGLHDMTNTSRCEALYRQQLGNLTARLVKTQRASGGGLLWVTTTPYMPARFANGDTIVEDLNDIAQSVLQLHGGIPSVDLHATTTAHCGEVYEDCDICRKHPCSFHYNDEGMNLQAAAVAAAIEVQLDQRGQLFV